MSILFAQAGYLDPIENLINEYNEWLRKAIPDLLELLDFSWELIKSRLALIVGVWNGKGFKQALKGLDEAEAIKQQFETFYKLLEDKIEYIHYIN